MRRAGRRSLRRSEEGKRREEKKGRRREKGRGKEERKAEFRAAAVPNSRAEATSFWCPPLPPFVGDNNGRKREGEEKIIRRSRSSALPGVAAPVPGRVALWAAWLSGRDGWS